MRFRTTFILFLLVVGLAVFVYTYERHQRGTVERRQAGSLTGFDPKQVDAIELKNNNGTAKFKKKDNGRWFLTEPFDDRVDPTFMARMLALAEKAEISETLPDDQMKDSDRNRYGLDDKSAIQIAWRIDGKTVGKLKIGKIGALGETVYAEAPGNKDFSDVYLLWARPEAKSVNLREVLNCPLEEMRDTRLLPFKAQEITGFTIRHPGTTGEIEVERTLISDKEATPWGLTKPLKARGEQKKIENLVGLFANARVTKLLPPTPAPAGLPANPAAEILFQDGPNAKGTTIRFYPPNPPDAKQITGYLTDRKTWFTIESEYLQPEVVPTSPNDLRSTTLADLNTAKITTMLIDNLNGESINLYMIGNRWLIKKDDQHFLAASADRIMKTIRDLNQAEVGAFVTDALTKPADYGLDHPIQTVTFATPDHVPGRGLGELTPKNSIVLQFGDGPDGRRYANFKGETSVYLMQREQLYLVPNREIQFRGLQILEFTRPSVRRFVQTLGATPPVSLTTIPRSYEWIANTAGAEVTAFLDSATVERILIRLGTLNVSDWVTSLQDGYKALQSPSLELEVDVEWFSDQTALDKPSTKTIKLSFAPSGDPKTCLFYYGHCTDFADYFLITREVYKELAAPVLKR